MIKKMIKKQKNFFKNKNITRCVICASLITLYSFVADAAVVSRSSTSTSRPTVTSSTRVTGRMPTASVNLPTTTDTVEETTEEPEPVEEEIIIENKANQFDTVLSTSSETSTDSSAENLAELIRQQRTELNAQAAINTANTNVKSGNGNAITPYISVQTGAQNAIKSAASGKGVWHSASDTSYQPQRGDIFYNFDSGGHTGVVLGSDENYVYTIEANTSSEFKDGWSYGTVNTRVREKSYISPVNSLSGYYSPDVNINKSNTNVEISQETINNKLNSVKMNNNNN